MAVYFTLNWISLGNISPFKIHHIIVNYLSNRSSVEITQVLNIKTKLNPIKTAKWKKEVKQENVVWFTRKLAWEIEWFGFLFKSCLTRLNLWTRTLVLQSRQKKPSQVVLRWCIANTLKTPTKCCFFLILTHWKDPEATVHHLLKKRF